MVRGSAPKRRRSAFTLVELLVVVVIIAVLLGLVLPSLKSARERTRTITCQTNLSGIAKGLISYALERDAFPITTDASGAPCSWRYGGWTGNNQQLWKSLGSGKYFIPTDERPLSRYMYHRSSLAEETKLPFFRCPSDDRSQRGSVASQLPLPFRTTRLTAYEDIGTSFHMNWLWFGPQTVLPSPAENRAMDRLERGERIWWKYMDRGAARFVALLEDPADFGFQKQKKVDGYHKKFSKHNFAFLDGHAEFIAADTTSLMERGRWTLIDESPPYKEWVAR